MKYKYLLDNIYKQYKKENEFANVNLIKFIKECNTNIVNFETDDYKLKTITGTIVEQNHLILIYYKFNDKGNDYLFFSKANINYIGCISHAVIYNCLWENGILISNETIGRNFKERKNLYEFNKNDVVIDGEFLGEDIEDIMIELDQTKPTKNKQKGYKM